MGGIIDIQQRVLANKQKEKSQDILLKRKENLKIETKKRVDFIKKDFRRFLSEEIDPLVDNYDLKSAYVIIRVFDYRPSQEDLGKETITMDLNGGTNIDRFYRTYPIAKILAAGPDADLLPGDIVKLSDYEAATIDNPRYEMWTNNPHRTSNLDQVGVEPPRTMNNFVAMFSNKIFIINPFKPSLEDNDYMTFKTVSAGMIKIKDPIRFIECI